MFSEKGCVLLCIIEILHLGLTLRGVAALCSDLSTVVCELGTSYMAALYSRYQLHGCIREVAALCSDLCGPATWLHYSSDLCVNWGPGTWEVALGYTAMLTD